MNLLLEEIFKTRTYTNSRNEIISINSETSRDQCEFLQSIIRENDFKNSLEIGFAFGMSTLAIVEEIARRQGHHLVIDKFQMDAWGGNGLDLVKKAGYLDQLEFVNEYCYMALPRLMLAGRRFDFAYIDSTKQFDWLMVNFFYIDKVMKVGGVVVFDDVNFPGIRRLLRYISRFPSYKVHSQFPANKAPSRLRQMSKWLKNIPKAGHLLRSEILIPDYELGLNANCIALQKVDEDKRSWDWHVDF
ncbi:MAG TPA: class I SAM-dependent methyltransferase [Puia sp.]|nr:class I SAM-dependent methyltransferase [Puia sp.]